MQKKTFCLPLLFLVPFIVSQPPSAAAAANDWYVRLTVKAPDDPPPIRTDKSDVFGRLHDSLNGLDSHDLPEMPPDSGEMGDGYLSIVFPHPEWGGEYDNYSSDYRAPVTDEAQGDTWKFEVRTRTPDIKTVISWEEGDSNSFAVLPRSRIKDAATGEVLVLDTGLVSSYTIEDTKEVNTYIWEYLESGRLLPANTWLMTASPCMPADPPGAEIVAQYGDDLSGTYNTDWISFKWDAANQNYVQQAGNDSLEPGIGNWNYSLNAGILDLSGTATPVIADCSIYGLTGACFAIDLVIPPAGQNRWNMVGHPLPYTVDWADVRIATFDGLFWTANSPSAAETKGFASKTYYSWNGSSYDPYDDSTPGSLGTLQPQDAIWVRSLSGSSILDAGDLKLLIPAR